VTIWSSTGLGLWSGALTTPKPILLGDEAVFRAGDLEVEES